MGLISKKHVWQRSFGFGVGMADSLYLREARIFAFGLNIRSPR